MTTAITAQVARFYEVNPYPHYPLWTLPKWQNGYLGAPAFCQRLASDLLIGKPSGKGPVLLIGCGEMQPLIFVRWHTGKLLCIDLSERSLKRAEWRTWPWRRRVEYQAMAIEDYLSHYKGEPFSHVDLYGVVHHLQNPSAVVRELSRHMAGGGTARLMLYNTRAREFIHHLSRAFSLLGLSGLSPPDIRAAQAVAQFAASESPGLRQRLRGMGTILTNSSRFADAFLHPRVVRLSIGEWSKILAQNELQPFGLFDRYGELDDLPNPLWIMPNAQALSACAADLRFENNLELFVMKRGQGGQPVSGSSPMPLSLPPDMWFTFTETRSVTFGKRLKLWRCFAKHLRSGTGQLPLSGWNVDTLKRLARIGALLPGMIKNPDILHHCMQPLASSMEPPLYVKAHAITRAKLASVLSAQRMEVSAEALLAATRRLQRAAMS